jgi:hypothetical protein
MQRPRRAMRPFRDDDGTGFRLQPPGEGRMVAMRMADGDMRHLAPGKRAHQRLEMRLVFRPRVDDGNGAVADDVAVRTVEGERARIVDGEPLDARRNRHRLAIGGVELELEAGLFPGLFGNGVGH